MPYRWTQTDTSRHLRIWPHRSLSPKGFVTFMAITCAMFLFPLSAVLGTPVLWAILPHLILAVGLLWYFLRRSEADGALREDLALDGARIALVRHNPRGPDQQWHANPYWVQLRLHKEGGPVENYITLKGNGREVEIGAFLSPEERQSLHDDLRDALAQARAAGHAP